MNDVSGEVAQIEHELDILRSRYTLMERSARVTKVAFVAFVTIMAVLAIYGMVLGQAAAIFMSIGVLVIVALLALTTPGVRWIDIVTPEPFAPWTFSRRRSEAQIVESQIAEREQRLAEITGMPS
jgi:hypothetical protein